jgi:hypothetical protein
VQAHQEVEAADNKCCDARYVHPKQRELVFRDHLQRNPSEHSGGAQRRRSKKRNVSNRCRAHGILSRKCIEPRHAAHVPIKRSRIAASGHALSSGAVEGTEQDSTRGQTHSATLVEICKRPSRSVAHRTGLSGSAESGSGLGSAALSGLSPGLSESIGKCA